MIRKDLTLLASKLYRTDYSNPMRQRIYDILDNYGLHYLTKIDGDIPSDIVEAVQKMKANEKTL